jgi:hypothetical protein
MARRFAPAGHFMRQPLSPAAQVRRALLGINAADAAHMIGLTAERLQFKVAGCFGMTCWRLWVPTEIRQNSKRLLYFVEHANVSNGLARIDVLTAS